jgi:hypothetical protein
MWKINVLRLVVVVMVYVLAGLEIEAQAQVGTAAGTPPYITAYKDEGFRGESEKFLVGDYKEMESGWKDEIKSIAITGAVRVTLFDKEQFEGKKLVVEHSIPKLGDFGGETESMIIEPFVCSYAIVFKKTLFDGESKEFRVGEYPELKDDWDDVQSIALCAGISATLYNKENFQGESVTIQGSRIDLGKFKKKVKSMKVIGDEQQ